MLPFMSFPSLLLCIRASVSADQKETFFCDTRHCPASQLKSTSRAGTPALPPLVCRALKKPSTKLERHSPSPATQATSCRVKPPSTVSLDTRHSGTALLLPAKVNHTHTKTFSVCSCPNMHCIDLVAFCKYKDYAFILYVNVIYGLCYILHNNLHNRVNTD